MPIYEYKCKSCGKTSELIVLSRDETVTCEACGSHDLEKLISAHNTISSGNSFTGGSPGGCCGAPNSCGSPGSCCSG